MELPKKFRKRINKSLKKQNQILKDQEETENILQQCEMIHMNNFTIDDDEEEDQQIEDIGDDNNNYSVKLEKKREKVLIKSLQKVQNITSHYILYKIIIWEEGDEQQCKDIFKYLEATVQKGEPNIGWLGLCYMFGCGVEQDIEKAVELFKEGSKKDEGMSHYGMGWCYGNGYGVEQNEKFRIRYYKLAAEKNIRGALTDLGVCYDDGIGVECHPVRAFEYYKAAAEQGCRVALNRLGVIYFNGVGTEKNIQLAIENYEKAGELGYKYSMWNLGLNYEEGNYIPQDFEKARKWYEKAAEKGIEEAQKRLDDWSNVVKRAKKRAQKKQKGSHDGEDKDCIIF